MFSRYKLGMPALYQAPASWEKLKKAWHMYVAIWYKQN